MESNGVKVEMQERKMAKLTVEVPAEKFTEAVNNAYKKNRGRFSIPGFRKGKAPQSLIEKMYGAGVFYEDAVNECINDTYADAAKESGLEIMSRPVFDLDQCEKGKELIYTAVVATRPDVKLGEYKGIEVKKVDAAVEDKDVDEELVSIQKQNARSVEITDRPVADGDTVNLDYAGTVDGVAFDGGTAEGQTLKIGSGTFIPGFEEQLIGVEIGGEKDVEVTFPEEYHAEDLAGKAAVFHCRINSIRADELPELDDDFAADHSDFETLAEMKEDIRKKLAETKAEAAKTEKENEAVDKLIEASEIDVVDAIIDTQADDMVEEYAQQLSSQGIPMDMYLKYTGMTEEQLRSMMRPQAEKRVRTRLVLEEVAKAEGIEVSEERFNEEVEKMAGQYKIDKEKMLEWMDDDAKERMKKDIAVQDAVTLICDSAKEAED